MRVVVFFDLPQKEDMEKKVYRKFVRYLEGEGFIRIQFSIFCKLCIHHEIAKGTVKKLHIFSPNNGDIRYILITEKQFQNLININSTYKFQEKITNSKRLLIIGEI